MQKSRVVEIHEQIDALNVELKTIQEACSHPYAATKRRHWTHDDYGKSREYGTTCDCTLCGKNWQEEGST